MKKVLLATTALVMTTGYAAAEVSFSGKASAGIFSSSTCCSSSRACRLCTAHSLLPKSLQPQHVTAAADATVTGADSDWLL